MGRSRRKLPNKPFKKGADTWVALAGQYCEHRLPMLRHENSRLQSKRFIDSFSKFIGSKRIGKIHHQDALTWCSQWPTQANRERAIRTIKTVLKWGVDIGLTRKHPLANLKVYYESQPRMVVTEDEYLAMVRVATAQERRILFIFWHTGMRTGELFKLRWKDLSWDRDENRPSIRGLPFRELKLTRHKNSWRTTYKERIIYLPDKVRRLIRWMYRNRDPRSFFVLNKGFRERGERYEMDEAYDMIRDLRARANVHRRITWYSFRHNYATRAAMNGVPIAAISQMMGHSSVSTTQKYLQQHMMRDIVHEELKKFC